MHEDGESVGLSHGGWQPDFRTGEISLAKWPWLSDLGAPFVSSSMVSIYTMGNPTYWPLFGFKGLIGADWNLVKWIHKVTYWKFELKCHLQSIPITEYSSSEYVVFSLSIVRLLFALVRKLLQSQKVSKIDTRTHLERVCDKLKKVGVFWFLAGNSVWLVNNCDQEVDN